jgi:hypothetical protein
LNKQTVRPNTTVYLNTLVKLYTCAPYSLTSSELTYLVDKGSLSAKEVVFKFDYKFTMDQLKVFLNRIITTIQIAVGQTITSTHYIFFPKLSKKEKDDAIESTLFALNKALAKEDEYAIKTYFSELCETACKHRSSVNATFCGEYSVTTTSARYLVKEFMKKPNLLTALGIDSNLNERQQQKQLQEQMLRACDKKNGPYELS